LAGYLLFGGLSFFLFPQAMLSLFFSNSTYDDVMVRFVGLLLFALGTVIVQIIRHNLTVLYKTTLLVRSVILAALVYFYFSTLDPLMITLFVIVGFGFLFTLISYLLDNRNKNQLIRTKGN
jgi:uncharacterized protein YjeT (DUF2065 family)